MRGKFITFEGLDGAGKSTFMPYARGILERAGRGVLLTREPGGTPAGEQIRQLLLNPESQLTHEAETLLIFAARQQHLLRVILPAVEKGVWVLCDRFTDSTYAYQGGGCGLSHASIAQLERWVQGEFQPDLTLLFDIEASLGQSRARKDRAPDRFEREALDFHGRVRQAYRDRAAEHPSRIRILDAAKPIEDLKVIVENYVLSI